MDSRIDELFARLYGQAPSREGAAFEMLFAAVQKILSPSQNVFWNHHLRGTHSGTSYQIDVYTASEGKTVVGEAKDYTVREAKVGRPDLQKLGGALPDLDVNSGAFASATGYTSPARKYAEASEQFLGKEIDLYELRPTADQDLAGRIESIVFHIHAAWPLWDMAQYEPFLHPRGEAALSEMLHRSEVQEGVHSTPVSEIYGADGEVFVNVPKLSESVSLEGHTDEVYASWWLPNCRVLILGRLIEVRGITFRVPIEHLEFEFSVDAQGNPVVVVKNEKHGIDKIITDEQLKKVQFLDDGSVTYLE